MLLGRFGQWPIVSDCSQIVHTFSTKACCRHFSIPAGQGENVRGRIDMGTGRVMSGPSHRREPSAYVIKAQPFGCALLVKKWMLF
jgi:hypothetical protein